jgi:3-(3-hydroxy-phenyl)propionate hydroxylase
VADLRDRIGFAFGDQPFEVVGRARYNVHHRYASRFRVGRVFLAGDAAHLMTPVGGLGLNTGFQDVNNLAWKLARVIREAAGASLLDTYQDERQSVARAVASHLADRNRTQLMLRSPLRRAARNALAALQARSGRHRWHVAHVGSLLGVKYGIQSTEPARLTRLRQILLPEARPPVRHGHRAPDGSLHWPDGHEGRLHDLLGQDFVALTFCDARRAGAALTLPDSVPVAHYVISPTDAAPDTGLRPHLLLDAGGRLRARFGAEDMTTYVLRPDGWVLAAGPHATIVRHISQTLHTFLSSSPDRAEEIMLSS